MEFFGKPLAICHIEIPYDPFYDAANWQYLTTGTSKDPGEVPVSLDDGSIRFFRANQAHQMEEGAFENLSFLLKGTGDFTLWLAASAPDNREGDAIRLVRSNGKLRVSISLAPNNTAAAVTAEFEEGEWNSLAISLKETEADEGTVSTVSLTINGVDAQLSAGDYTQGVTVNGTTMSYIHPSGFTLGNWFAVKAPYADSYVQLKPVSLENVKDVPIVACVGDSITAGSGSTNGYTKSFPAQLQALVGGKYNVLNYGLSGRTVRCDLPADGGPTGWLDNVQWKGVQAIMPDIVFVKLGTNDSKTKHTPPTTRENFEEAFRTLTESILGVNPRMKLVICTSATAFSSAYSINNDNITRYIVPVQKQIAEEMNAGLIDLNEITKEKSALFPDGIHPNDTGYAMFAEIFREYLERGTLSEEFLAGLNETYSPAP